MWNFTFSNLSEREREVMSVRNIKSILPIIEICCRKCLELKKSYRHNKLKKKRYSYFRITSNKISMQHIHEKMNLRTGAPLKFL